MFKTVVVGADDSATARQAVAVATDMAEASGAALHIVTGYDSKSARTRDLPDEFRYAVPSIPADNLLHSLSAIPKQRGLDVSIHPLSGAAANVITRVAKQEHADLVVVGNKGMAGLRRMLRSVPNSVAHRAPCSVLIVDTHTAAS
jgi:nucleotide-binding universal stress UspA family protein